MYRYELVWLIARSDPPPVRRKKYQSVLQIRQRVVANVWQMNRQLEVAMYIEENTTSENS